MTTSITCFASELPSEFSNKEYVDRINAQENSPWCVTFAVCNAIESQMRSQGIKVPDGGFSKAWLYARCKELDNDTEGGTEIDIALEIAKTEGLCPDYLCPTKDYLNKTKLPELTDEMTKEASKYKIDNYEKINITTEDIKKEIYDDKFIIIGTKVESGNWHDDDDLILPTKSLVTNFHATYLVGYNDNLRRSGYNGFFVGANSWSSRWGNEGFYNMAYEYIESGGVIQAWVFEIEKDFQLRQDIYIYIKTYEQLFKYIINEYISL